jgi:hypothetical protein
VTRTTATGDIAVKSGTSVRLASPKAPGLHVDASGDVVWVVIAEGPDLEGLLAALP